MITSSHRFHGRSSLRFVYQRGQMTRSALLSLRSIRNPHQQSYRAAVVVSRKVSKSAVVRNRIRRRIYEIIRLSAVHFREPYDLVFTVYGEEIAHKSHASLKKLVHGQLQAAGALPQALTPETDHDIVKDKETNT
jgi:ribonuclease P protein component